MGKFTKYDDTWIDEQIQSQLNKIVEIIKDIADKKNINIKSIILTGGFGRGEGSVMITDKKVIPLKDYDILVIIDGKLRKDIAAIVREKAYQKLQMNNPEKKDFRYVDFVIDIRFITEKYLVLNPDIATYELKKASHLLWGEDIREKIPWTKEDIPPTSPLRFLFEKTTGLIGHFLEEYLHGKRLNKKEKLLLIYECYKTYVEICTALCFLMGCYEPYYEKRMKIFCKNFEKKLPKLYEQLPHLPKMVKKCTYFKLKPNFEKVKEHPIDLWFKTRNDLIMVLKYYLEQVLKMKIDNWRNSYESICKQMKTLFRWRGNILLNKIGIESKYLADLITLIIEWGLNWRYSLAFFRKYGIFLGKQLIRPYSPMISIFLVSPLILLSLNRDGSINRPYFEEAKKRLRDISIMDKKKEQELSWNDLRRSYLRAYYVYWGG